MAGKPAPLTYNEMYQCLASHRAREANKEQWAEWDAAIRKIQQIVAKLGEKHKLPVVHFQKVFDEAAKRAPAEYWLFDGVHPAWAGHQLMADAWVRAVREAWPQ